MLFYSPLKLILMPAQLLLDTSDELVNKGLYAIGSLVRNQAHLCHAFLSGGTLLVIASTVLTLLAIE